MSTPECNPGCLPEPEDHSRVSAEFKSIMAGVTYSVERLPRYGFNVLVFLPTWLIGTAMKLVDKLPHELTRDDIKLLRNTKVI